ncbi:MAG: TIGR02466 family protein [Hyphomicrobiaceae bacterium]
MSTIEHYFVTKIYRTVLRGKAIQALNADLSRAAHVFAEDDHAGRAWSAAKNYGGYTSYASLNDLTWRAPEFGDLKGHIDGHVRTFARDLDFDLSGAALTLNSLWVNLLEPGGSHSAHIHPHSVLSGTYYVDVPAGAGAIRFEDPRHAMMMAAPPRKPRAKRENQPFVTIEPKAGMLLLWESWLRHDVPTNDSETPRLSISFNYGWGDA